MYIVLYITNETALIQKVLYLYFNKCQRAECCCYCHCCYCCLCNTLISQHLLMPHAIRHFTVCVLWIGVFLCYLPVGPLEKKVLRINVARFNFNIRCSITYFVAHKIHRIVLSVATWHVGYTVHTEH